MRESIAHWYKDFLATIDPDRNVLVTIGVKEAIALISIGKSGDGALVPDPGYPTYFDGALFAGARLLSYKSDFDEEFVFEEIERKPFYSSQKLLL